MPKKLEDLLLEAVDEFVQLARTYDLLMLCIEQLQDPSENHQDRVKFLLELSLPQIDLYLRELRLTLERIYKILKTDSSF